jgi:hypothetical protein
MKRLLLACTLVASGATHAEFWNGNDLLMRMNGQPVEQMQALGYVMGVFDSQRSQTICPPSDQITAGQTRDIVRSYLERNPQHRHHTGDLLTTVALATVWPCKKGNGV